MRHQPKAHSPTKLPRTVAELVVELDRQYPEPNHGPGTSIDVIMFHQGQRSVVLQLKAQLEAARLKDYDDVLR